MPPQRRNSPTFSAADHGALATTVAAGRRRPLLLPRSDHLFLLLVLAYVAIIGLWPLIRLFSETFTSVPGQPFALLQEMWSSRSLQRALSNTITASLGATLIATIIGSLMAL